MTVSWVSATRVIPKLQLPKYLQLFSFPGTIDFNDFLSMMTQKMSEKDSKEEILKAFRLFDDDETGKISFKNLKRVAKELGENLTDEELQVCFLVICFLHFNQKKKTKSETIELQEEIENSSRWGAKQSNRMFLPCGRFRIALPHDSLPV